MADHDSVRLQRAASCDNGRRLYSGQFTEDESMRSANLAAVLALAAAGPAAADRWVAIGTGVSGENGRRPADYASLVDLDAVRNVGEISKVQLVRHYPQGQYLNGWQLDREVVAVDLDCGRRTALVTERFGHGWWSQTEPKPPPTTNLYDFRLTDRPPGVTAPPKPIYKAEAIAESDRLYQLVCRGDSDHRPFWMRPPLAQATAPAPAGGAWTSLAVALAETDRARTRYLELVNAAQLSNSPAPAATLPKLPWNSGYLSWGWGDAAWLDLSSVKAEGKLLSYRLLTYRKDGSPNQTMREEQEEWQVVCSLGVRRMNRLWSRTRAGLVEKPAWIGFVNWYPAEGMESVYLCKQDFRDPKVVKTLEEARAAYEAHERKMDSQRK
jgi:hypothetical protein